MPLLAVAAVMAGGVVAAGVVAASTITMIGIGATVVGKITKSKELMQIGAGMSLGAGVGSLATGAFGAAEGAASAAGSGDAAFDSWAAQQGAAETAAGGAEAFGGSAPSWAGASGEGLTSGMDYASANSAAGSGATAGLPDQGLSQTPKSSGLLNASSQPQSLSQTPESDPTGNIARGDPMATGDASNVKVVPPGGTDSGSISKWWGAQPETVKNRILQMGGQAVGGMFDGWSAEQKLALERERVNLEKQKLDMSVANMNSQPTVSFKKMPASPGLLYSQRGG